MAEYIVKVSDKKNFDGSQKVLERHDLIRCKDCKFRHMDEHGIWFCENHDVYPEEDWFCADGERRDE